MHSNSREITCMKFSYKGIDTNSRFEKEAKGNSELNGLCEHGKRNSTCLSLFGLVRPHSRRGLSHSCPILSNRFHPTKQHSICCRSENCISLAISGQSAVDSIDSFDLSNGKVYYRFDKCGRRSDKCISLMTTATRCKIVESNDSFDWWEWLFHS